MRNRRFTDRWSKSNVALISSLTDEWVEEFMQFCINNRPEATLHLSLREFIVSMSDDEFKEFVMACRRKF